MKRNHTIFPQYCRLLSIIRSNSSIRLIDSFACFSCFCTFKLNVVFVVVHWSIWDVQIDEQLITMGEREREREVKIWTDVDMDKCVMCVTCYGEERIGHAAKMFYPLNPYVLFRVSFRFICFVSSRINHFHLFFTFNYTDKWIFHENMHDAHTKMVIELNWLNWRRKEEENKKGKRGNVWRVMSYDQNPFFLPSLRKISSWIDHSTITLMYPSQLINVWLGGAIFMVSQSTF